MSNPYTIVLRNDLGEVTGVLETREAGLAAPADGERDIGLFIFRKEPVFDTLREDLSGKWGAAPAAGFSLRHWPSGPPRLQS